MLTSSFSDCRTNEIDYSSSTKTTNVSCLKDLLLKIMQLIQSCPNCEEVVAVVAWVVVAWGVVAWLVAGGRMGR